jgi:ABC-type multidrug transport system ATPase subunit
MTLKNPYRPGRYVTGPQFYGRQDILHTLEHDDYRGAYIIGTRQIGKTSLLREMERRLPAFYVDVSYMGHDLFRWAKHLQRSIGRKREDYAWLPSTTATAAPVFLIF